MLPAFDFHGDLVQQFDVAADNEGEVADFHVVVQDVWLAVCRELFEFRGVVKGTHDLAVADRTVLIDLPEFQ